MSINTMYRMGLQESPTITDFQRRVIQGRQNEQMQEQSLAAFCEEYRGPPEFQNVPIEMHLHPGVFTKSRKIVMATTLILTISAVVLSIVFSIQSLHIAAAAQWGAGGIALAGALLSVAMIIYAYRRDKTINRLLNEFKNHEESYLYSKNFAIINLSYDNNLTNLFNRSSSFVDDGANHVNLRVLYVRRGDALSIHIFANQDECQKMQEALYREEGFGLARHWFQEAAFTVITFRDYGLRPLQATDW